MKRKLIRQANQAYTITLPIEWVRKNRLDSKSEVSVDIHGKSLVINSENLEAGGKAEFNAEGMKGRNLYRHITALYARGTDEVIITCKKDITQEILRALQPCLGFTVVEQKGNEYKIKDISAAAGNLDDVFKRVFQIILTFYDQAIQDIFGKREETLEGLKQRDTEVNKLCLYLQRAISKQAYDPATSRVMFTYSYALEQISDEIERLWRTSIKYEVKRTPKLKELCETSKKGLEQAFRLYYQFTRKAPEGVYEEREKTRELSTKFTTNSKTLRLVRHAVKVAEQAADLTHLTLMMRL